MADGRNTDSVLGLFLRLYWMLLGNGVVAIAAASSVVYPRMPLALPVAGIVLGVVSLIAARFVDIRSCGGQTADGAPADLEDWKRYVKVLILTGSALIGLAWGARRFLF